MGEVEAGIRDCLESMLGDGLVKGTLVGSEEEIAAFRVVNPLVAAAIPPACVLRPSDAEELQKLVRIANQVGLNLTITSSAGRHCRGGSAASKPHVAVDVSGWKRISWIDRRNRVCIVEPGVTYGELLPELAARGMTLPTPLSPRRGKSVAACVLDREPSTWPNRQWDSGDPLASTEFLFGSGERFRTGAAGGPGTLESQRAAGGAQKSPAGPSQTDFHRVIQGSQGTMGVVVWVALRTELSPTLERPLVLGVNSLSELVPFVYDVQRPWLGEHSLILDRTAAALLVSAAGDGSFEEIRASLPRYLCLQNVAGFERLPEERVEYQTRDIEEIARDKGLRPTLALGAVSAKRLLEIATAPGAELDWRHHRSGHCLSISFLTTLDRAPGLVEVFESLAGEAGIGRGELGSYLQPVVQNHACHVELLVPFDPESASQVERMRELERKAVAGLARAGAFFSRPYGAAAEVVFQQNRTGYEMLGKVKNIFDPNRVLNAGKWYGDDPPEERIESRRQRPESGDRPRSIADHEIRALEEIVGSEWVSTDACMLDTYSFYMNPETLVRDGGRFTPRPAAVVLPETTQQVSEIVRFCNGSDLMVKPLSTGFHAVCAASRDRVIVLDLKRMNKILDIDVANQIAVIEPYVRGIDLQTELFKHGLNVHVASCGSNHSILASTTAAWGYGMTGSSMGYSGRNLLGVEWVLPSGEIATLGSAGSRAGWFTADGPGPSLRGIMRGFQGSFGGLGVFTKCAVKLYKWEGPARWKVRGQSPVYLLGELPPRMSMNVLAFPSKQAMKDAGYKLGEAEIEFASFRTPMFFGALGMTENNEELKVALDSGVFQKDMNYVLVNAVVGRSEREFRWKMRALKAVLRETGGVHVPMNRKITPEMLAIAGPLLGRVKDPLAPLRWFPILQDLLHALPGESEQKLEQDSRLFWLLVRNAVNTQATFRPSQGMSTVLGAFDTWDLGVTQSDWIADAKQPYIQEGVFLDDGGDLGCGGTFENGHLGYQEGIYLYDSSDPRALMASGELIDAGANAAIERSLGVPIAAFGSEMNQRFGPHCGDYPRFMSKIKRALDPNTASDPFFFAEPESGDEPE